MNAKFCSLLALPLALLSFNNAQAICIKNESEFPLYYEIHNKNPCEGRPKIKEYKGTLKHNEEHCYAHTQNDPDWNLYRRDDVNIFKIDQNGAQTLACNKRVDGILNRVDVSYIEQYNQWWCLDRHDRED